MVLGAGGQGSTPSLPGGPPPGKRGVRGSSAGEILKFYIAVVEF